MKKEIVLISASPNFIPPRDAADARTRLTTAKREVAELQSQLENRHVTSPVSGERMTTPEYFKWKRGIGRVLALKQYELNVLKTWAKEHGVPMAIELPKQPKAETYYHLLWRTGHLLHRLVARGAELAEEEQCLLDEIDSLIELDDSKLLEEARACMQNGWVNVFQFGSMIAQTTRDEQDLAPLMDEYQKLLAANPRDEVHIRQAAEYLVDTLAVMGRFEDAAALAETLDQTSIQAAYVWLRIGDRSENDDLVGRARAIGSRAAPSLERKWFFAHLYVLSGDPADSAFVQRGADVEDTASAKKQLLYLQTWLVKGHAMWDRRDDALNALRGIDDINGHVRSLAYIVEYGEREEDAKLLLMLLIHNDSLRYGTIRCAAAALAKSGHGHETAEALTLVDSWFSKCGGYCMLARFMNGSGPEMLERAERLLTTADLTGNTHEGDILFSLAVAQALNGHGENALRTVRLIKEREAKCHALLFLYAHFRGEPMPAFLEDVL